EKYSCEKNLYVSGAQAHTKGALLFNHLIDRFELGSKIQKIRDGDKIKFVYLTVPNRYKVNAMSFGSVVPPEFRLDEIINWEMMWEKTFMEPLDLILKAIKWKSEKTASLDDLFM